MSDHNWKNAAPEVPEEFHMKFEETLKQIERQKIIHHKKKSPKMMIRILIAAAILCSLAVTTIVAGELFQWNDVLKKRLNPSKEQQESLADQGYIKGIGQSQTQNGVTITLVNTLQDQKLLYALFKIETDDSISMDETMSFEDGLNIKIDGTSTYDMDELGSRGAGAGLAYPEGIPDISPHLQYYEVSFSYSNDYDLSGKTVQMELKNLTQGGDKAENEKVVAEGVWKFEWTLDEILSMTRLDVNRRCDFGGYEITVEAMEISPLQYTLYLDYEEAMKVYEDERNRFEYNGDDPGMDLTGRTHIDQVRYEDGTVVKMDYEFGGGIGGGGESWDEENKTVKISGGFAQAIDVERLEAVHFGNVDSWLTVK